MITKKKIGKRKIIERLLRLFLRIFFALLTLDLLRSGPKCLKTKHKSSHLTDFARDDRDLLEKIDF